MDRIKLSDCKLNLDNLKNIICIGTFGSYNTYCFDKSKSDIDIMILSIKELEWKDELEIEDYLIPILQNHFQYDNIHLTFINGFIYPFGEMLINSNDKIIILEEKYLDYILGYSTFKRDREYLEIIREQNLKDLKEYRNGLL
ncbi:nucleotidyltransferase domain-containing protein [Clostridium weizhouense]|uniref:Nucleotidyltransferase domain-containing protein n=1 Tax=Clostridium weizhouense TaxID=2859781 RepID=A0ABS7APP7_9CLOT|nr:nucleotidyltransferase domain-containing protein [Clostridium weizhouense]MBW6410634.1 nucleotidyltransferase domain-containing protein [Clostridium weizhouense]